MTPIPNTPIKILIFNLFQASLETDIMGAQRTALLAFLDLCECVRECLFCARIHSAFPINVMRNFMHENIIEEKCSQSVQIESPEIKRVGTQKHGITPVKSIDAEGTRPRLLLFSSSAEEEYRAKSVNPL